MKKKCLSGPSLQRYQQLSDVPYVGLPLRWITASGALPKVLIDWYGNALTGEAPCHGDALTGEAACHDALPRKMRASANQARVQDTREGTRSRGTRLIHARPCQSNLETFQTTLLATM